MTEKDQQEMLENIYTAIITRNGEMAEIRSKLIEIGKFGTELAQLKCIVIGDGTDTHVGIVNELRVVRKWIEARAWFERILIAAIACEFIALVFLMVKVILNVA